jgi:hypothetical protein
MEKITNIECEVKNTNLDDLDIQLKHLELAKCRLNDQERIKAKLKCSIDDANDKLVKGLEEIQRIEDSLTKEFSCCRNDIKDKISKTFEKVEFSLNQQQEDLKNENVSLVLKKNRFKELEDLKIKNKEFLDDSKVYFRQS